MFARAALRCSRDRIPTNNNTRVKEIIRARDTRYYIMYNPISYTEEPTTTTLPCPICVQIQRATLVSRKRGRQHVSMMREIK